MFRRNYINIRNVAYFILFLSCTFLSGHSLSLVTGSICDLIALVLVVLSCVVINARVKIQDLRIDTPVFFIICMLVAVLMAYVVYWNNNMWVDGFVFVLRLLVAYFVVTRIDLYTFVNYYSVWLTGLTLVAFVIYVLVAIGVPIPCYAYTGINDLPYRSIGLCTWSPLSSNIRGPFWESGLYASMAVLALVFEMVFSQSKPRKSILTILVLGVLFSKSTAGYILLFLAFYIAFVSQRKHKAIYDVITILLVALCITYEDKIVGFLELVDYDVFWKLSEQCTTANTRLYSPIICLDIFLDNPVTGFGLSYAVEQYNNLKPVYEVDALTSTSVFMLSAFGFLGILYTLLIVRGALVQKNFIISVRLLFVVLLLSIVNKEPHTNIIFTYIILFYMNKNVLRNKGSDL